MHSLLPFLLAMIAAIVLLNMWATKLKVAYPIVLVVAGLVISFIPGLPVVKINPDLIFFIFLPPLLFESSWMVSFKEMKKWWRIITSFAFLVVFFTALTVAIVANHYIPGFTLALGFLLGGIVSPPDAVSTGAITKFVKIPKSTSAILEGESLLNDASALIIYRFALLAVGTGQFVWQEAAISFVWMLIGGAAVGLGLAWIFVKLHKYLPTDTTSDIALTIVEPYFMYWLAEQLHCSGVLAVVSGGLFMSTRRLSFLSSSSRISAFNVWESFVFILNGIVFLVIGLELSEIVDGIKTEGIPLQTAILYGVIVTVVIIAARIVSSYTALVATMIFRPNVIPQRAHPERRWKMPLLLGWTGMRGVVSLAAALAIPIALDNGKAFPQRNLILFITFIVILLTLIVQGLTLPGFIIRSKLFDGILVEETEESMKSRMRHGLKQEVFQFLKNKYDSEPHAHGHIETMLKRWEEKTKSSDDNWMNERTRSIYVEMLEVQRRHLSQLIKDPRMDEDVIRQEMHKIDLEEEKLKMM